MQNVLKKQANDFVQSRKQQEQLAEEMRWNQVTAVALYAKFCANM